MALLAACAPERRPIMVVPVGGPLGAPVAGPGDEGAISLGELAGYLDDRMVDRVYPRSRDSVEVVLCDRQRLVVALAPVEVQAEMLRRAYRPGCR